MVLLYQQNHQEVPRPKKRNQVREKYIIYNLLVTNYVTLAQKLKELTGSQSFLIPQLTIPTPSRAPEITWLSLLWKYLSSWASPESTSHIKIIPCKGNISEIFPGRLKFTVNHIKNKSIPGLLQHWSSHVLYSWKANFLNHHLKSLLEVSLTYPVTNISKQMSV